MFLRRKTFFIAAKFVELRGEQILRRLGGMLLELTPRMLYYTIRYFFQTNLCL